MKVNIIYHCIYLCVMYVNRRDKNRQYLHNLLRKVHNSMMRTEMRRDDKHCDKTQYDNRYHDIRHKSTDIILWHVVCPDVWHSTWQQTWHDDTHDVTAYVACCDDRHRMMTNLGWYDSTHSVITCDSINQCLYQLWCDGRCHIAAYVTWRYVGRQSVASRYGVKYIARHLNMNTLGGFKDKYSEMQSIQIHWKVFQTLFKILKHLKLS